MDVRYPEAALGCTRTAVGRIETDGHLSHIDPSETSAFLYRRHPNLKLRTFAADESGKFLLAEYALGVTALLPSIAEIMGCGSPLKHWKSLKTRDIRLR